MKGANSSAGLKNQRFSWRRIDKKFSKEKNMFKAFSLLRGFSLYYCCGHGFSNVSGNNVGGGQGNGNNIKSTSQITFGDGIYFGTVNGDGCGYGYGFCVSSGDGSGYGSANGYGYSWGDGEIRSIIISSEEANA